MRNFLRAVTLAAVALAAGVVLPQPTQANTALRDGTISSDENVGGKWVRYTADATYLATTPGTATVACNSVVIGVPVEVPYGYCWLDDLDSTDYWETYSFPYFQSSYNVQQFVIDHPRRLQLCMRIDFLYSTGPTRCSPVA